MTRPLIGITTDYQQDAPRGSGEECPHPSPPPEAGEGISGPWGQYLPGDWYRVRIAYARAVTLAGGTPVLLAQDPELAEEYVRRCDGLLFTGGADLIMEDYGQKTHPAAKTESPWRLAFERALLGAAERRREMPVLGVCMGMQLMGVRAGAQYNQHLPETLGADKAAVHVGNHEHPVVFEVKDSVLPVPLSLWERVAASSPPGEGVPTPGTLPIANCQLPILVHSSHHQAVVTPGTMRLVARAPDGVIEAIDDPSRPFYLGVQWHPERGGDDELNLGVFRRLIAACGER